MWRFQLCSMPSPGTALDAPLIGELFNAKDRELDLLLNRGGSLKFNMSLTDELAPLVQEGTTCVKAWRENNAGVQVCRWSGPVWTAEEDIDTGQLSVSCVGWLEELVKRLIRDVQAQTARYTMADPGEIVLGGPNIPVASSLLGLANAQTDSSNAVRPTHITAGTYNTAYIAITGNTTNASAVVTTASTSQLAKGMGVTGAGIPALTTILSVDSPTQFTLNAAATATGANVTLTVLTIPRTISYQAWQSIGQAIQALSDIEDGFDIIVDPITRRLSLPHAVVKAGTTVYGRGQDRPNALFMLGGGAQNLITLKRQSDMASIANRFVATNAYGSAMADDIGSTSTYGIFEEQGQIESGDANVLLAYAGTEVVFRAKPQPVWSMAPFDWSPDSNVPRLFDDYDLGDFVYLIAEGGRQAMTTPQAIRVFGVNITIDNEGNEKVSQIQVAPAS